MRRSVYIVWGPSPEWGDGMGVVGYETSLRKAQAIIKWLLEEEENYGPRSWVSARYSYIERVHPAELGWDGVTPLQEFVQKLNESI